MNVYSFKVFLIAFVLLTSGTLSSLAQDARIMDWKSVWPKNNFENSSIDLTEIMDGGIPRGAIPAIDNPIFSTAKSISNMGEKEPVISVEINGDARAYPVRILMYHEVVNDVVGDVPVTITFCPLCNASLVYERTIDGAVLDFEATGKLRKSDLVMYDRQTETWWQQFTGEALVGHYNDRSLTIVSSQILSLKLFIEKYPGGKVQVPNDDQLRDYGNNPYIGYDSSEWPFLFSGVYQEDIPPLARVVAIGSHAWPLTLLKKKKVIKYQGMVLTWQEGQNSPLDTERINNGRDIGSVIVTKNGQDINYHVPFSFAYRTFNPEGVIHLK